MSAARALLAFVRQWGSNDAFTIPTLGHNVTATVTNTGKRAGDEVAQLYVRYIRSRVERPNRDLRGFRRVSLNPGGRRTVRFSLPASSLAYWNAVTHAWEVEPGSVALEVGASSGDIRLRKTIRVMTSPP